MIIAVLVPPSHVVQFPIKPVKIWTAIPPLIEPSAVPDVLTHHENAFIEDETHDWTWRDGRLRYYSRCVENDEAAWIFIDVGDSIALRVGQFWKTRAGEVRKVVKVDPEGGLFQVVSVCLRGFTQCNYQNGMVYAKDEIDNDDLIKFLPAFTAEPGTFEISPNSVMAAYVDRKPQRFRWVSKGYVRKKDGCCVWNATHEVWEIHTFGLHKIGYFEGTPDSKLPEVIGPVHSFEWLDNDFSWNPVKP
jgi:hypothetical protein